MPISGFAKRAARNHPGFQATPPLIELGGLNEDENPQALKTTDLSIANNCVRKGGMTGTRPGVSFGDADYAAALSGTPDVNGIHEYTRDADATRDLVVVAGGNVFIDNTSGALDKSATTITAGKNNFWTFADFQGKMFAAGGADSDGFWFWDGSGAAPGVLAEVGISFDVKFVFSKWNILFVAGMDGTTFDDNPMVARYCDYASDATVAANWKTSNVIPGQLLGENFGVGSWGSEFCTGLASFQDNRGDFLLFLTNRRIVGFVPNPSLTGSADAFKIFDTVGTGCVGQNAFVNLGLDVGDAVYIGPNGIHSLAQSQEFGDTVAEYLSWPIRKTWDTIDRDRLKFASAGYWPNEGMVLFAVSTGSNTTNNLILCMDIKNSGRLTPSSVRWYKWDLGGMTANIIQPARDEDGTPYLYVGGNNGEVVRFDREVYADLTTNAINTSFQTRHEDFGLASREKHVGDVFIALQGIGDFSVQHTLVLDDGLVQGQSSHLEVPSSNTVWGDDWGVLEWGGSDITERHRVPGIGSSPTIAHRFTHSGANEPFWVGSISQEVMVSGPTDDATSNVTGS